MVKNIITQEQAGREKLSLPIANAGALPGGDHRKDHSLVPYLTKERMKTTITALYISLY